MLSLRYNDQAGAVGIRVIKAEQSAGGVYCRMALRLCATHGSNFYCCSDLLKSPLLYPFLDLLMQCSDVRLFPVAVVKVDHLR
jgi:hypothetical protein